MLKSVRVGHNSSGASKVTFDVIDRDPLSPYVVKTITGLSQVDAEIFRGDLGAGGSYVRGRRAVARNVVFNIKLQPDWANNRDLQEIRAELYRCFLPRKQTSVSGLVREDNTILLEVEDTEGRFFDLENCWTEKIEIDIWAREPVAQISVMCPNPFLIERPTVSENMSGTTRYHDFPVGGSESSGIQAEFVVTTATDSLYFRLLAEGQDLGFHETSTVPFVWTFMPGETVVLNTIQGQLTARVYNPTRYPEKGYRSIVTLMTPGSVWLTPAEGTSRLAFGGTYSMPLYEGDGSLNMTRFSYKNRHWGV